MKPSWEYKDYPQCQRVLLEKTNSLYRSLWRNELDIKQVLVDTRSIHQHLFSELTPLNLEFVAGHYRGEDYEELKNWHVGIKGNRLVGCPPELVIQVMGMFRQRINNGLSLLDEICQTKNYSERLKATNLFACETFVKMTQIHPYVNGNGHIARFMLIAVFKQYGFTVKNFPIDPRPKDSRYIEFLRLYEQGDKKPFLLWIAQHIEIP
ncbi:MAG: Fic family protein [Cyanobacteria bacterium P01_E01_bin.6]